MIIIKFIIEIILLCLFMPQVNAINNCDVEESVKLNREVVNIKINYEEKVYITRAEPGDQLTDNPDITEIVRNYFQINLLNLSDNFYAVITDSTYNSKRTFNFAQAKQGVISFDWRNLSKVSNLTVNIYSSNKTKCPDNLFRTLYLTIPRYNNYYEYDVCNEIPDYYLCQKYVTFDEVGDAVFYKGSAKEIKKKTKEEPKPPVKKSFLTKLKEFFNKHQTILGVTFILVISGIIAAIIIYKYKKNKEMVK